jgi:hypothetical protein
MGATARPADLAPTEAVEMRCGVAGTFTKIALPADRCGHQFRTSKNPRGPAVRAASLLEQKRFELLVSSA